MNASQNIGKYLYRPDGTKVRIILVQTKKMNNSIVEYYILLDEDYRVTRIRTDPNYLKRKGYEIK